MADESKKPTSKPDQSAPPDPPSTVTRSGIYSPKLSTSAKFSRFSEVFRPSEDQKSWVRPFDDVYISSLFGTSTANSTSSTVYRSLLADDDLFEKYKSLDQEKAQLRKKYEQQAQALKQAALENKNYQEKIRELELTKSDLETKEKLGYILDRISQDAHRPLLTSGEFQKSFLERKQCTAFVLSVDIRRSTELMLKARSPTHFSDFITALCKDLMSIVIRNYGIFDKFTGDGVLAFFPDFFSGADAAFRALNAADQCHDSFRSHYKNFRGSFKSVLTDVGLGIGIDYGTVELVEIASGLTVVGEPVVYACRLSGAPSTLTYLNQPAYEQITKRIGAHCAIAETTLQIKHEGNMLAYQAHLNSMTYLPELPTWLETASVGAQLSP